MKLDISNLSNANRRIRLVPKEGATITLPETAVNPTVMFEDTGALVYCLSPKPPALAISCDGATDRSGKLSFDGPVVFKLEPDGEVVQFANEAELVAWIKAHPETGLTVKDFNRPDFEYILPIATTAPTSYSGDMPFLSYSFNVMGKNLLNQPYSEMCQQGTPLADGVDATVDEVVNGLCRIIYPMSRVGEVPDAILPLITLTKLGAEDASVLNSLLFKDELIAHMPVIAEMGGEMSVNTGESTDTFTIELFGFNIDLSKIDKARSDSEWAEYFNSDGDSEEDKQYYFSTIEKIVFVSPDVYSTAPMGPITNASGEFANTLDIPHFPAVMDLLMTSKQVTHTLGGDVEFSNDSKHMLEPLNGNIYYLDYYSRIAEYPAEVRAKLEATKMAPARADLLVEVKRIEINWDSPDRIAVYSYFDGNTNDLTKVVLPELVSGETLRIACPIRYPGTESFNNREIFLGFPPLPRTNAEGSDHVAAWSPSEAINAAMFPLIVSTNPAPNTYRFQGVIDLKVDFDINTVPPADRVIYVNNQFGSLEFSIIQNHYGV